MEENRKNLPEDASFVCIEGGNHAWFGDYGEQKGDGMTKITQEKQWQETADAIDTWSSGPFSTPSAYLLQDARQLC